MARWADGQMHRRIDASSLLAAAACSAGSYTDRPQGVQRLLDGPTLLYPLRLGSPP